VGGLFPEVFINGLFPSPGVFINLLILELFYARGRAGRRIMRLLVAGIVDDITGYGIPVRVTDSYGVLLAISAGHPNL
jgi:hypothetical protein